MFNESNKRFDLKTFSYNYNHRNDEVIPNYIAVDAENGINTMDIHISLDKNTSFDFQADSYEYHCAGGFNTFGTGYLEVSNLYPIVEQVKYESELLVRDICRRKPRLSESFGSIRPYRFWSGKRNTKVWLVDDNYKSKIDISNLAEICDAYRVLHVNVRLNTYNFNIERLEECKRLDIMDIYLAEK